jgi:hypothetical protein
MRLGQRLSYINQRTFPEFIFPWRIAQTAQGPAIGDRLEIQPSEVIDERA